MRTKGKQFKDVILSRRFYDDYEDAPPRTQRRINTILRMISDSGKLPNSLNEHRTDPTSNLWIGYVTVTRAHYRLLFTWDDEGNLIFLRLLNHNQQDALLSRTSEEDRLQMVAEYL